VPTHISGIARAISARRIKVRSMLFRRVPIVIAVMTILALTVPVDAFARAGGGFSFGSRGSRSFSPPPVTMTAPRPAAPFGGYTSRDPGYASRGLPSGGFFSGGFGRGLIGGLFGAGLFGLLFGNGLFGGLGGGTSLIGLIIQLGLIYLAIRLVIGFFRSRQQPAFSSTATFNRGPLPGAPPGLGGTGFASGAASSSPLQIQPADFDAFERRLGEVQTTYGAEDIDRLRRLATPEMVAHFAGEIDGNARRGVVNRLSDVRLLQGDLAEAWREPDHDFATVAMRYSLIDAMVDRATGRPVSGSPTQPQQVTELWTFTRPSGTGPAEWRLSAIQQA
jgi:predicted lipid-binding transport protein (Tim44 family)